MPVHDAATPLGPRIRTRHLHPTMSDPSNDPNCWIFPSPLDTIFEEDLIRAIAIHRPQDRGDQPVGVPQRRTVEEVLAMGDWLTELKRRKNGALERLLQEGVLKPGYVKQRIWLSSKVPPGDPLRQLSNIPVGHLRALVSLENSDDLLEGVRSRTVSVRELLGRLKRTCAECSRSLPQTGDQVRDGVVAVTFGNLSNIDTGDKPRDQRRKVFCSAACARDYLDRMIQTAQRDR